MTIIDDISTVGEEQAGTFHQERIAFLNGKLEAQHDFFREQITELKSSLTQTDQENLSLKAKLQQVMQEKGELEAQAALNMGLIERMKFEMLELQNKVVAQNMTIGELEKKLSSHQTPEIDPLCIWKSTADAISYARDDRMMDVLNIPGFQKSVIQWKIKILHADGLRLGVVSSLEQDYTMNLGQTNSSWGYGGWGDAWHNNCRVGGWHIEFNTGSIIAFRLDLNQRGTLSVSVDDKPMIQVFDGMKKENETFSPAVYLFGTSRIKFIGLQECDNGRSN